ncbi:MAG: TonB-dependent receptor [Alphaproteobacteria bacterium]
MARGTRAWITTVLVCLLPLTGAATERGVPENDGQYVVLADATVETVTVTGKRLLRTTTATKTDTPLHDVPQAITVVTGEMIEELGMRSMADVVRYVPGVTMGQGEGHRDAPTLRGNSTTADFFIDGVRDDVQYFRDLYNAERIEVLKGPNAMIFGRGGGGGVINRVSKWADGKERNEWMLRAGSFNERRVQADLSTGVGDAFATRLNAMYENSRSYRNYVRLERLGVNPAAAFLLGEGTTLDVSYEYFKDDRTVDRGVPSRNGRPLEIDPSTFFGNPRISYANAEVNLANAILEHEFSDSLRLRNRTLAGNYAKFYQNVHPNSAVNSAGDVTLQAYNSSTDRRNIFNQTDVIWETATGGISHTLLAGAELGWQDTDNVRAPNTSPGTVNIADPTTFAPVVFGSPPLADNRVDVGVAAFYAQDQVQLTDWLEIIAGLRFDRFTIDFDDRRPANADFSRTDEFVSPRAGIVLKPVEPVSLYASYTVSYLPQSGDQFASLDATTSTLKPEKFENVELGIKWEVYDDLAITAAAYSLERTNTPAVDPDTGLTVLTGAQRSEGIELELIGSITDEWEIVAGYAYQEAKITRATKAAPAGRKVPLVPEHMFSLWSRYDFAPGWGVGLGVIHQGEMFASISNAVTIPSFTRADAAVFLRLHENVEAQVMVENVCDETYWPTAHNDNNITPGSPRALRIAVVTRF